MLKRFLRSATCQFFILAYGALQAEIALAAQYSIGSGGTGGFALLGKWLQEYINFMTGPYAKGGVAAAAVIGIIAWTFAPKDGVMGTVVRVVAAGFVSLNIGTWMGMFGGTV
jgi:type IV secretory pathway VirB2 component (pilin)